MFNNTDAFNEAQEAGQDQSKVREGPPAPAPPPGSGHGRAPPPERPVADLSARATSRPSRRCTSASSSATGASVSRRCRDWRTTWTLSVSRRRRAAAPSRRGGTRGDARGRRGGRNSGRPRQGRPLTQGWRSSPSSTSSRAAAAALTGICKAFKKNFSCNGAVQKDAEMGEVIQLSGDQRGNARSFLVDQEICHDDQIVIHGCKFPPLRFERRVLLLTLTRPPPAPRPSAPAHDSLSAGDRQPRAGPVFREATERKTHPSFFLLPSSSFLLPSSFFSTLGRAGAPRRNHRTRRTRRGAGKVRGSAAPARGREGDAARPAARLAVWRWSRRPVRGRAAGSAGCGLPAAGCGLLPASGFRLKGFGSQLPAPSQTQALPLLVFNFLLTLMRFWKEKMY